MTAALARALSRFDAAATRYRTAVCEIAALNALPPRDGFMRTRNAERADWERRKGFEADEMRRACKAMWAGLDADNRDWSRRYLKRQRRILKTAA
jgi:hypothetical protein